MSYTPPTSKTCPQCRTKAVKFKLYLDFNPDDSNLENVEVLKNKIDSMTFDLKAKDVQLQCAIKSKQKSENQIQDARDFIKKLESRISTLVEEVAYGKTRSDKCTLLANELKAKNLQLENCKMKINRLSGLHLLMSTEPDESNIRDIAEELTKQDLITLLCISKRDLKQVAVRETSLAKDLRLVGEENYKLKMALQHSENKVSVLTQMNETLKSRAKKELDSSKSLVISCSNNEENHNIENLPSTSTVKSDNEHRLSSTIKIKKHPLHTTKKSHLHDQSKIKKYPSIFKQSRSTIGMSSAPTNLFPEFYDGLGGSSRLSEFPRAKLVPCKIVTSRKK